mgnify:CR=1 FL=1
MKSIQLPPILNGTNNLNTTPESFSNLDSNIHDYHFFGVRRDANGGNFTLRFNSDSSTNYRDYHMRGRASATNASSPDSKTEIILCGQATSQPAFFMGSITGETGGERVVDFMYGGYTSSTEVLKKSAYWKDTINPITSIDISCSISASNDYDLYLYSVPKERSQGGWEKVDSGSINRSNVNSNPYIFTGLDLNSDKEYKLVLTDGNLTSGVFWARINGDNGNNYTNQRLMNKNGAISASNVANYSNLYPFDENNFQDITINIKGASGIERLVTFSGSDSSLSDQFESVAWWGNTVDNVTSFSLTSNTSATLTVYYVLYRRMTPSSTDVLPWELVESVDVSGDFSAGHTFSGLEGDSTTLYKVEVVGEVQDLISIRINGNSGADYIRQWLRGQLSAVTANSNQLSYFSFLPSSNIGQGSGSVYIYPKSGTQRPMLSVAGCDEEIVDYRAGWYTDTTDEITSILVYSSASNPVDFRLKLWRLK